MTESDVDTILATVLSDDVHKACGCGRTFTAHEWSLLESVGRMSDNVETLELRNCPCGSTIATVVDLAHADTERPCGISIGDKVRASSGAWPCGCEDSDGEVTKLEEIDDELMAFVGTSCGWQWFPIAELKKSTLPPSK